MSQAQLCKITGQTRLIINLYQVNPVFPSIFLKTLLKKEYNIILKGSTLQ